MATNYSPDKWKIVKFKNNGKYVYKVLAGWSGGYLDADSWRLSSGLERIEEEGDHYLMYNYSGSIYKCHKNSEGFTLLSDCIYNNWIDKVDKSLDYVTHISTISVEEFQKLETECN